MNTEEQLQARRERCLGMVRGKIESERSDDLTVVRTFEPIWEAFLRMYPQINDDHQRDLVVMGRLITIADDVKKLADRDTKTQDRRYAFTLATKDLFDTIVSSEEQGAIRAEIDIETKRQHQATAKSGESSIAFRQNPAAALDTVLWEIKGN